MNGPWDVRAVCTPRCAAHTTEPLPLPGTARRATAFAGAAGRALTAGPRLADPVRLRAYARALLAALSVGLEVRGAATGADPLTVPAAPGAPGTLIALNHISWLDIVALLAVEPATLLAKREVGHWPLVGGLARRAGTHFIDRTSPRRLPQTVRELSALLAAGRSVAVFPQATTWCTADQGAFRRATFQAALDAGAPVRPVTVDYVQQGHPTTVAAFCGDDTFAASLRRVITARGLTVRVTVHPALPTAGRGLDRRALAGAVERVVLGGGRTVVDGGPGGVRPADRPGQALGTYL
ncbi:MULTISPECIES: lysophospholipid acyltransferase family protein [Streptomyces]|uniref:lysophospholipid acyltransferase family protein n=1 Tax=Streptomyces TaxID=1883 RepID=UPI001962AF2F|nr:MULTISPECIES: lysophospholipid acyltransferase family protein [Streptomyces]QRX91895.1 1-acyl-sn-glycerol-3-phosphate acyltransferase [Streptomyces noursei]UJB41668.1 1-acyl-sn-glycerol-3-phosphate acyltransferase [Streptomyces sp. A1-5]